MGVVAQAGAAGEAGLADTVTAMAEDVGTLTRREVDRVVVAYSFDLRTNEIATTNLPNPSAGREHVFKAYRVAGDPADAVSLRARNRVLAELGAADAALNDEED